MLLCADGDGLATNGASDLGVTIGSGVCPDLKLSAV